MCLLNFYSEAHSQAVFFLYLSDTSAVADFKSKAESSACGRTVCTFEILRFHEVLPQKQTSRQTLSFDLFR